MCNARAVYLHTCVVEYNYDRCWWFVDDFNVSVVGGRWWWCCVLILSYEIFIVFKHVTSPRFCWFMQLHYILSLYSYSRWSFVRSLLEHEYIRIEVRYVGRLPLRIVSIQHLLSRWSEHAIVGRKTTCFVWSIARLSKSSVFANVSSFVQCDYEFFE